MKFHLIPQPKDYWAPLTDQEQEYTKWQWKNLSLDVQLRQTIQLEQVTLISVPVAFFSLLGLWSFNSLVKDIQKAAEKSMSQESDKISDKIVKAQLIYDRSEQLQRNISKLVKWKSPVVIGFGLIGLLYGSAQCRLNFQDHAEKLSK